MYKYRLIFLFYATCCGFSVQLWSSEVKPLHIYHSYFIQDLKGTVTWVGYYSNYFSFWPKINRNTQIKDNKKIVSTLFFLGEIHFFYKILSLYSHRTMLRVKNLSQQILNSLFVFRECAKILFYHSGRIRQKYLFIFKHYYGGFRVILFKWSHLQILQKYLSVHREYS